MQPVNPQTHPATSTSSASVPPEIPAIPNDTLHLIFRKLPDLDFRKIGSVSRNWQHEKRVVAKKLSYESQTKLIEGIIDFFDSNIKALKMKIGPQEDFDAIDRKNSDHLDLFALNSIKEDLNLAVKEHLKEANLIVIDPSTLKKLKESECELLKKIEAICSALAADQREALNNHCLSYASLTWQSRWPGNILPSQAPLTNIAEELSWVKFRTKKFSEALFLQNKHAEGAKLIDSQALSPETCASLKLPLVKFYRNDPEALKQLLGMSLQLASVENEICEQASTLIDHHEAEQATALLDLIRPRDSKVVTRVNAICLRLAETNQIRLAMNIALSINNPRLAKFSDLLEHILDEEEKFDELFGEICSKKGIETGLFVFESLQKTLIEKNIHTKLLSLTRRYAEILVLLRLAALYLVAQENEHFEKTLGKIPEGTFKHSYQRTLFTS